MDGSVGIAAGGLVLLLLLRPWRLEDQADRDYAALAAAVLLGMLLIGIGLSM